MVKMSLKKLIWIGFLILNATLLFVSGGWSQTIQGGKAPVITISYAVEKGRYGHIWKVYLEAEDPDADMYKIASVVEQPGYGSYPADFIILKLPYRKNLKGYIQWNTFSSKTSMLREWTQITLRVSIIDKAGNESNEVVFPFEFASGAGAEPKPPTPFDQKDLPRLGYIHIDLFEPTLMGGDSRRDD